MDVAVDIEMPDNAALLMGDGGDLKIFHNGGNSQINDLSTGNLQLLSNGSGIDLMKTDGEYLARFYTDAGVDLYTDNSVKFATTATGATLTGKLVSSSNGENFISKTTSQYGGLAFQNSSGTREGLIDYDHTAGVLGIKAHTANHYTVFQTGGYNERLRIAADGKIGAGVSSPAAAIHLKSSSDELRIENTGTAQWNSARLRLEGPASANHSTMLIHGNTATDSGDSTRFAIELADASGNWVQTMSQYDYTSRFWSWNTGTGAGSERMRINSDGRIAITHSSPDGESLIDMGAGENSGFTRKVTVVNTGNSRAGLGAASNEFRVFYADDQELRFKTISRDGNFTTSEKMVLDRSGNLGLNVSSPGTVLHVNGTGQVQGAFHLGSVGSGGTRGIVYFGGEGGVADQYSIDNQTGNYLRFKASSTAEAYFVMSNVGYVGIGCADPNNPLEVAKNVDGGNTIIAVTNDHTSLDGNEGAGYAFYNATTLKSQITSNFQHTQLHLYHNGANRISIHSDASVSFGTSDSSPWDNSGSGGVGSVINHANLGLASFARSDGDPLALNRLSNDGNIIAFYQDGTLEGSISVSGATVSYNGGHLSRWSQLPDNTHDDAILKGTVMTNLDEMCVWKKIKIIVPRLSEDEEEIMVTKKVDYFGDKEDGETDTVEYENETFEGVVEEDLNEQRNKMAVSSVESDKNVSGVFVNYAEESGHIGDMNVAMTGDMVIRIAEDTAVQRGDLLESKGDGTAQPQDDDIVRSSTIAKVISTSVTKTYDDNSYLVPCVLMAC